MGENLDYSPEMPPIGEAKNDSLGEPGFREVVETKLDGVIPFEGAITEIATSEDGTKRYTVEGTKDGQPIKEVGLREENLKRFSREK